MKPCYTIVLIVLTLFPAGCAHLRHNIDDASLQTPIEIMLGKPGGAALGPLTVRSGQMFVPPRCCPPLELRDSKGDAVREFDVTASNQRFVAPPGSYTLVGHDPGGEECVLRVEVTNK